MQQAVCSKLLDDIDMEWHGSHWIKRYVVGADSVKKLSVVHCREAGKQDVEEKLDRSHPVDARCLDQFLEEAAKELVEKESRGGRSDQRNDQALIGVQHTKFLHHFA